MSKIIRLDKRVTGPWANYESYLMKPENTHVGWIKWIDDKTFRIHKNPLSKHPSSPYLYYLPEDIKIPTEEGLIRVDVEKISREVTIPRGSVYGIYRGQVCHVAGYQPVQVEDLPRPILSMDEFLHRLTDNWHGEKNKTFSTEIALNILSSPKSSYAAGGIGAQSLSPYGTKQDLIHLNSSLRGLLPDDFLKQNKWYIYKPIRTQTDAENVSRACSRMLADEISYNYIFSLSPEVQRVMMPTQIPVIIPDAHYSRRKWGLDSDVFDYEMGAMLIHPYIEERTQKKIAGLIQQVGRELLKKSFLQLPLDNTGVHRLVKAWARLNFKHSIDEDDFMRMKNDVVEVFTEFFDILEDFRLTGKTTRVPLTQMADRRKISPIGNKIFIHVKRIARETGMKRLPLTLIRGRIPEREFSDFDLEYGLQELVLAGYLLQHKNYTEFELV